MIELDADVSARIAEIERAESEGRLWDLVAAVPSLAVQFDVARVSARSKLPPRDRPDP